MNKFAARFGPGVIVAGVYYLVARFCLLLALEATNVTAIWPPTGMALAAVLLLGYRIWPAIALGAFFANLGSLSALGFTTPLALAGAFSTATGNTLEALVGAFLILHFSEGRNPFGRTADIVKFVLFGALLSTTISASIGTGTLCILKGTWSNSGTIWLIWWAGDAAGALIITPLIMTWESRRKSDWTPLKITEAALILGFIAVIGWVVFGKGHNLPYLFTPLLVWTAFRFGQFETACLILLVMCLSIWGAVEDVFIYSRVPPYTSLLLTQVYISIISLMTMVLNSLISERNTILADLRSSNVNLQHEINERKRAEEERLAHLWFFKCMDQINRAIQGANDLEQMMGDVLDAMLSIFDCDRAWLIYPCDPEAASWRVAMERTRPEYPTVHALGLDVPVTPDTVKVFRAVRAASAPVRFGPESEYPLPVEKMELLRIQSMIAMAIYPKGDNAYLFGLHQCTYPRVWTSREELVFQEVGRRLTDALTGLLAYRDLGESEERFGKFASNSPDVIAYQDRALRYIWIVNPIEPYTPEDMVGKTDRDFMAPEDAEYITAIKQRVIESGQGWHEELACKIAGKKYWFDSFFQPVHNKAGEIVGIDYYSRNISERKIAEEELKKLNDELEQRVRERTAELEEKNRQLERMNRIFVGRELRMIELKKQIKVLEESRPALHKNLLKNGNKP